ncbi:long-chain fatty acid transport protein 2-like [Liolophura sinensis]|uniref:long-chain fatty acid transport protein 2-like n=1 Tax=Liolophura sinensis TaxID=3198878 RepID=UPI0031580EAE
MYEKAVAGVFGACGASYAAYKLMFPWLGKDLFDLSVFGRLRKALMAIEKSDRRIGDAFDEVAGRTPDKYFIIFNDRIYTYGQILDQVNRIAHIAKSWNLKKGDVAAVFMENEPAFVAVFLGLQKCGIPLALINHNLKSRSLEHCLRAVDAKVIICGSDEHLMESLLEVLPNLSDPSVFVHGLPSQELPVPFQSLTDLMADAVSTCVGKEAQAHTTPDDVAVFFYTSGTTGLPKPVRITHVRTASGTVLLPSLANMTPEDVVYTTVPLYHSSGFLIGLLGVIGAGATMVLRKKFSASHFWEDCCRHKITIIQYIGELIRYLMVQPESDRDTKHCVRVAVGNGLREDVWEKFQKRHRIPMILEFFAATEGTTLMVNLHNVPGACGRYSPLVQLIDPYPKYLVKYEPGTDQPLRDKNGRCIKVKRGEPGLLLSAFPPTVHPDDMYHANKAAVEKKLARDVFKKGDLYFNYGDLLYLDDNYFFHFADRIGDTFRWKGENVSTQEVANVLATLDFILDANVYGVEIPGQDGKAGMACLVLSEGNTDLTDSMCKAIYKECVMSLPSYARPLFLRVQAQMELTGTYKQRKVELVKEGFDPNKITDPLFWLDTAKQSYVPLNNQLYSRILIGHSRL